MWQFSPAGGGEQSIKGQNVYADQLKAAKTGKTQKRPAEASKRLTEPNLGGAWKEYKG